STTTLRSFPTRRSSDLERPVNMMFQSYALFPHMSAEKNVAFGLEQEGLGREQIRRQVAEILEIVKMGGFGARKPHQLSGGQRQRSEEHTSELQSPYELV